MTPEEMRELIRIQADEIEGLKHTCYHQQVTINGMSEVISDLEDQLDYCRDHLPAYMTKKTS